MCNLIVGEQGVTRKSQDDLSHCQHILLTIANNAFQIIVPIIHLGNLTSIDVCFGRRDIQGMCE